MKLVCRKSKAFSQGDNIKADIKGGWCAGITALVSRNVGEYSLELGMSHKKWIEDYAYKRVTTTLDGINNSLQTSESLQMLLGRINNKEDVCKDIHTSDFNGHGCKVLLSASTWVPLFGYVSYIWQSKWLVNHVGYLVRGDDLLLIFDPNYGVGLFSITDDQPLNLDDLTKAIRELAWANSVANYYLSSTVATAVIDEDALRLDFTIKQQKQFEELSNFAKQYKK